MKKYARVLFLLYFSGFAAGILCSNLLMQKTGYQTSLLPVYLLASGENWKNCSGLFAEFLVRRGKIFAAGVLLGLTPAGIPGAVISALWFGFLAGSLETLFLLEYGFKGMIISGAGIFPQALFYIPGWLLLFFVILQMGQKSRGNLKRKKEDYESYFFFSTGAGILILLGIWLESYVNQNVLQYILAKWI